jgi:hypothetical protein
MADSNAILSEAEIEAALRAAAPVTPDGRGDASETLLVPVSSGEGGAGSAASRAGGAEPTQGAAVRRPGALLNALGAAVAWPLAAIDRPFAWIPIGVKQLIGWAAIASLVVSVLALYAMPALLPRRDAFTFLQEKLIEMRLAAPSAGHTEGAETSAERGEH